MDGYDYCDPRPDCCDRIDFTKDADEVLDFKVNWTPRLGTDSIVTSTFTLPDGLTQDSASHDTTSATIFVSRGSSGRTYRVVNRITTAGGRTYERTVYVAVTGC